MHVVTHVYSNRVQVQKMRMLRNMYDVRMRAAQPSWLGSRFHVLLADELARHPFVYGCTCSHSAHEFELAMVLDKLAIAIAIRTYTRTVAMSACSLGCVRRPPLLQRQSSTRAVMSLARGRGALPFVGNAERTARWQTQNSDGTATNPVFQARGVNKKNVNRLRGTWAEIVAVTELITCLRSEPTNAGRRSNIHDEERVVSRSIRYTHARTHGRPAP